MRKYLKHIMALLLITLTAGRAWSQCGSSYISSDDTIVCIPQIVKFKANSFPAGTTFEWNFGTGYVPGDSTASRLYTNAGSYSVSLKLKYKDGTFCIISLPNFIVAKASPTPVVDASKSIFCHGADSVLLTDNTANTASRDWLINSVLYKNGPKSIWAKYDFPAGPKSVYLFVKDVFGCQAKRSFDTIITLPDTVQIDFSSSALNGCVPKAVSFSPNINQAQQNVNSYQWTFPKASPGTSSLAYPVNIQYSTKDSFDVTLKVTTDQGCTYTHTKKNFLRFADSLDLNVLFSATQLCASTPLTLSLSNGRNSNYGLEVSPSTYNILSDAANVKKLKFNNTGQYSFHVSDTTWGCVSEKTFTDYVLVKGPISRFFMANPVSCLRPDTFEMQNQTITDGATPVLYKWLVMNDSTKNYDTTATSFNFKAILRKYGEYTIKLVTVGNNGCRDTMTQNAAAIIRKMQPDFTWTPLIACPNEQIRFLNATPLGSSKAPNLYKWTFYDDTAGNKILYTDTSKNPVKYYPDTGRYTVKLVSYNKLGCKDSIIKTREVKVLLPVPLITISDSLPCRRQSGKMSVKLVGEFKDFIFRWDFKHKDSAVNLSYIGDSIFPVFDEPGIYNLTLVCVSKSGGCTYLIPQKTRIKVSGAKYKLKVTPDSGCDPLFSTLSATATNVQNYKNGNGTSAPFSYMWRSTKPASTVIASPTAQSTSAIFKQRTDYQVWFSYKSPSGCIDSNQYSPIVIGVKSYPYAPSSACVGKLMRTKNFSYQNPVQYKWYIDTGSSYQFYPSDTSFQPGIMFGKPGVYKLGLIAIGKAGCRDTAFTTVQVNIVKAQFASNDTINYCAPAVVTFTGAKSLNIYRYIWHYGDGDSTDGANSQVSHVYEKNTGPSGHTVKLVVQGYGCFDTLIRPDYIKIIGPVPDYDIADSSGCEPLTVKFKNKSKFFSKFYLDFGDGTTLDSSYFDHHVYKVFDRSLDYQVYKSTLALIDSFGCSVAYSNPDSVVVLKSPIANYTVPVTTGCELLTISFKNISDDAQNFYWDFDNDGTIDSKALFPVKKYLAGEYDPVLIAEGGNGCRDTISNKYHLISYPRPVASFTTDLDTVCNNFPIKFFGKATPDTIITKWQWDFGEPFSFKDVSTDQNPTYQYKAQYLLQPTLIITDKNNCKDTAEKFVYVYDTLPPGNAGINYVTVINDNDIYINWAKSKYNRYKGYYIYEDKSGYYQIFYTNDVNDTDFVATGVDVHKQTYGYNMKLQDNCNIIGKFSTSHFTIFTHLATNVPNQIEVNWGHYQGWNKIEKYYIYRSRNGGSYQLIDSVAGDINSYNDIDLCNEDYCYYIVAMNPNGKWFSRSNTACGRPVYVKPQVPVTPVVSTVLSNGVTYTRWQPYTAVAKVKRYVIERSYPGGGTNQFYDYSDSTGYIDNRVDVQQYSYTYKIKAEDHCGSIAPASTQSKTILLKATSNNYVSMLVWNPYDFWNVGVKRYSVRVREKDGTFKHIAWVSKDTTSYVFNEDDFAMEDSLCFKVVAIRDDNTEVESHSNIACTVAESQLWVPDAFSPNGDGHNDIFLPRAILVYNKTGNTLLDYKLEIYNRWGELIFLSNDVKEGWDGTTQGVLSPTGVYVFKIKALGLDGQSFHVEGNVSLLR